MSKVEIFQDNSDPPQWRYRIKADNGEIVASSEAYTTKESAERGAKDLADIVSKDEGDDA